jgi:hypothetical protein
MVFFAGGVEIVEIHETEGAEEIAAGEVYLALRLGAVVGEVVVGFAVVGDYYDGRGGEGGMGNDK